ncbi:MAG: helix-turn-helix transcriptional regulator [Nocardioidaceae bacterium]
MSSPELVGRGEQLALLGRAMDEAGSATPRLVVVEGEAGIGKSRLLSDFTAEASRRGVTVLRGSCVDLGDSAVPHLPLRSVLAELVDAVGVDRVLDLVGPGLVALSPLQPELAERAPPETSSVRADASQLFDVVARLLDRLSHETPLLLAVEDLHWADGSTRGLLGYLARAMRTSRVLVVVTARTEPPPTEHTTEFLDELARLPSVDMVRLTRLDRDDVARQLRGIWGRSASAAALSHVTRLSQGVPFLVEELARTDPEDQSSVPETVRNLVLVRTRSLGHSARQVLGAAAVAATALDERSLSDVADLPAAEVELALRELVDDHLLVLDRASGRYEFRHALLREATQSDLLAAEAGRLHRRCAELFETSAELAGASGRAEALVAHHWWMAGADEQAFDAALVAADGARAVHAYEEELALRRRALDLWPRVEPRPGAPDRVDLLWHAANAADRFGELDSARDLYQAARRELSLEEQPARAADLLYDEVGLLRHLGDLPETEAAIHRVLAVLPAEPSLARARALVALQAFHYQRREIDGLRTVTRETIAVANQVGAPALAGWARLRLVAARAAYWDESSHTVQRDVRALAAEAGDTDLLLVTYINESDGYLVEGCFTEAARLARAGQRVATQRGGKLDHQDLLLINLVCALIASGDWTEAQALLDDALLVDRPGALRANMHGFLAEVRLARGDLAGAEQSAAEAHLKLERLRADPQSYPFIAAVRGDVALARGRAGEALEIVRRMYDGDGQSIAYPNMIWPALHVAARAIAALAQRDRSSAAEAIEWLAPAAARQCENQHMPWWSDAVEAELSSGDAEHWRVAVAAVEHEQTPVLLRLRVALGAARAELSTGSRGRARDLLVGVLADAERLGAGLVLDEARDFAQRSRLVLATTERKRDVFGLTVRELEVLQLLAVGMSNRQIGDNLFLSPKTVSIHVSHILAKLGVGNRGEAAAVAFTRGLTAQGSEGD